MTNNYLQVDHLMTGVARFSRFSHELSVTKCLRELGKSSAHVYSTYIPVVIIYNHVQLLTSWLLKFSTYNQFIQLFANFLLQVQKYLKHKWFWLFSLLFHCALRRRRNRGNGIFRVRLRQIFGWSVPTSRLPRSVGDLQRVPIFLIIR